MIFVKTFYTSKVFGVKKTGNNSNFEEVNVNTGTCKVKLFSLSNLVRFPTQVVTYVLSPESF